MKFSNALTTRFWRRLGHPLALGAPSFGLALIFIAVLSFTFDAVRLRNFTFNWIPLNVLSILFVLVIALPVLWSKRRQNQAGNPQPIFNIVFAGSFFGFKNVVTFFLTPMFGIEDTGNYLTRFLGGLIIGLAVLILFTNIVGTRLERESTLKRLGESESQLVAFRSAAFDQLEEENRKAADNAVKVLTPQLEDLQRIVKESSDIVTLANRMKHFIANELRPLGANLSDDAISLSTLTTDQANNQTFEPVVKINLSKAIRVWISLFPMPLLYILISIFTIPAATIFDGLIATAIFAVTLTLLKYSLVKVPELPVRSSFVAITIIALLASTPSYLFLYFIPNPTGIPELMPAYYALGGWSVLAASQSYILDVKQEKIEARLNAVIQELSRENKLYEQKAWLARHGWYLLLHGVVQPALTTASMRVAGASTVTDEVKSQILEDLRRALNSLTNVRPPVQGLDESISDVISVWKGISDVDVEVEQAVRTKCSSDPIAAQVINEVMKEVVSNAVRHGNAEQILVRIGMIGNGDISFSASNDGRGPIEDQVESTGSRMLSALTLNRSLHWDPFTKSTEFSAVIPMRS